MRTSAFLGLALLAPMLAVHGQGNRIVDEASFTILIGGRTAGRENFRISSTTRGDEVEYVARADVTYGDRRLSPELRTDSDGGVIDYQVTTRTGASTESWKGVVVRGRLNATIASDRGTSAREYVVPAGAMVLDEDVMHQHWFLARRVQGGSAPVVLPRRANVQAAVSIAMVAEESLPVGNREITAKHLRATISGEIHDIWTDGAGRLLRVAVPSRGLVAVRDDPPPA